MKPERQLVSLAGKVRKLLAKLVQHQMDYGLKESKDSVEHADTYLGGRYEM
jgi:ribosomal protein L7/L12